MIPKIIHYCWFGGKPFPKKAQKCIESWRRFLPDCEIIRWSEDNFDVSQSKYAKQAYDAKKWAFVADYARGWALVNYGGIYMDTDMLLLKNMDFVFDLPAFCGLAGPHIISMGLLGARPHHTVFEEYLNKYNGKSFLKDDGSIDVTTNVTLFSNMCLEWGLSGRDEKQQLGELTIFPTDFFYPTDFMGKRRNFTENTCAVHLHQGSWLSPGQRFVLKFRRLMARFKIDAFLVTVKRRLKKIFQR